MSAFSSGSQSNGEQMRTTRYQALYPSTFTEGKKMRATHYQALNVTVWFQGIIHGPAPSRTGRLRYSSRFDGSYDSQMRATRYQALYLNNLVLCLMGLNFPLNLFLRRRSCMCVGDIVLGQFKLKPMGADVRHALPGLEQYSLVPRDPESNGVVWSAVWINFSEFRYEEQMHAARYQALNVTVWFQGMWVNSWNKNEKKKYTMRERMAQPRVEREYPDLQYFREPKI
ncbi:hypothetical protein B0H13DRAFT_1919150 [Mycena leptocephala]|nr:hypothetical protein B0H13DRAFT_1919150 [Mycena leptocephala]